MTRNYSNKLSGYVHENGGRAILLFLLFILAIYEFVHSGLNTFALVCLSPILVIVVYVAFTWRMFVFYLLLVVNWFIQFKNIHIPGPTSLPNELLELLLISIAIIDVRHTPHFGRAANLMLASILIWFGLCFIELFNDTCGLGFNWGAWFQGFRLIGLQLLWILLVFSLYITDPKSLNTYIRIWAVLSLFSVFWTWKMINYGFTVAENAWLNSVGHVTHIINGGTLIRYWSTFSDAANYGCNASASAIAFLIFGITAKVRKDKLFYLITSVAIIWGMFQSGTRTAIYTMIAGFAIFLVLAKSFKIMIPSAIVGAFFLMILMFTDIGNGNQQIRRMRSAFDKKDASANVRDINKASIAKYLKDAPWGIGVGMYSDNIPAWNKFRIVSQIPPDSEYVFIWVRTGSIGVTVFTVCMVLILIGGCLVVLFKLRSPSLIGIGGGLCSAFVSIQLGGYANQVLFQYPNGLTFFGGMAIVYLLPHIEKEWIKTEKERLAAEAEQKRLKLEKKLAKRV
jgi:hypothetical protein